MRRIDETFGLLSVSTNADNLLLWAHYAIEHRGLAVEINVTDPAFVAPEEDARPVHYSPERPLVPETDEILFEHFFVKSPEWTYEQEFRNVRKLANSVKTITAVPYPIHLFSLPSSAIRRVVFGARVPEARRRRLISDTYSDPTFRHVRFAEAVLDPRRFKIEIRDL